MQITNKFFSSLLITTASLLVSFQERSVAQDYYHEQPAIGVILSLSGEAATEGSLVQDGIRLALSENKTTKIQAIYEDDRSADPKQTLNALQHILSNQETVAVMDWTVQGTRIIAPTITSRKIPTFVIWDRNNELENLKPYVHPLGISTEASGQEMANLAVNRLNKRAVAVITAQDFWSEIISRAFSDEFKKQGGKIDDLESVRIEETDFRSTITRLKKHNIPAIYAPIFGASRIALIKQAKQMGYTGVILTGDLLKSEIDALENYSDGIYSSQVWCEDSEFLSLYEASFSKRTDASTLGYVMLGYNSMKHVLSLIDTLRDLKKEVNATNLQELQALQPINASAIRTELVVVEDGKFVRIQQPHFLVRF